MRINICGVNMTHDHTFSINKPNGSGDYLFINTNTPILINEDGRMTRYPIGTTVFFMRGEQQHFMAAGNAYADDFIHFDTTSDDEERFISSLNIKSGKPYVELDSSVFLSLHRYICMEHIYQSQYYPDVINDLMHYFLVKLSQAMKEADEYIIDTTMRDGMIALRNEIYRDYSRNWTVSKLAASMNLSPSYFQATYKRMFKRPCISDVIYAKIERAKLFLTSSDYSIGQVARLCGYDNESHFSRQFKKVTGMTASEYRTKTR